MRQIISNDELFKKSPQAQEMACSEFGIEDVSVVREWEVELDHKGQVEGVIKPIYEAWYKQRQSGNS